MNLVFLADEEFDQLCFDFGIELDDIVSGRGKNIEGLKEKGLFRNHYRKVMEKMWNIRSKFQPIGTIFNDDCFH